MLSPDRVWYGRHWLGMLLAPLGWLYCTVARLRRAAYRRGWVRSYAIGVPVIVVGNLTVGGTGKTPLVLWLVEHLTRRGYRPGIVLRGYGGTAGGTPRPVPADGEPAVFGDEAVLLERRAGRPVVIGRDRVAAGRLLARSLDCDLVVSDDGLQHYRLARDLEILVVDGRRGFGSGRCLPAGPLREPIERARAVNLVVRNDSGNRRLGDRRSGDQPGFAMTLQPAAAVSLSDPEHRRPLKSFGAEPIVAVAGIGNPGRFFDMLRGHGLAVEAYAYPDHHPFSAADILSWPEGPVLMTEKDMVKCGRSLRPNLWYVPVSADPAPGFVTALDQALERVAGRDGRFGVRRSPARQSEVK